MKIEDHKLFGDGSGRLIWLVVVCAPSSNSSGSIGLRPTDGWRVDVSSSTIIIIITGSIARSAARRYFSYSEADFEVFRPAGATRCTDGVKFGKEEGTEGPCQN